jgi:alpha-L-fucosidase 2
MDCDRDCGSDAGAEWVWVRRPAEAEAVAAAAGWSAAAADEEARPLKVVFASPARYFTDASPIGNGRLGAMVWGGVESERLQLNRKSIASPPSFCLLSTYLLFLGSWKSTFMLTIQLWHRLI